jgi:hypothetical protein
MGRQVLAEARNAPLEFVSEAPACLESIYKVPFSGSGGFRSVETAGCNPRRQWNAALQAQLIQEVADPMQQLLGRIRLLDEGGIFFQTNAGVEGIGAIAAG